MEIKNIKINYDINRSCPPNRISVTHVNDINTRIIELTLIDGGDALEIGADFSAEASIVERKTKRLINNSVACEINESGNIIVPIDNFHFRNCMDINIEISVYNSSNTQVLTLPYPLWVRVNPSVLDDAEVSEESLGTVPELLEDAKKLVENYRYELTEEEMHDIAELVDVTGKEDVSHKKTYIDSQSQTGDSEIFYPTVGAVRNYVNYINGELDDYLSEGIDDLYDSKADKSSTLAGYGITDAYTKAQVDAAIQAAIDSIENRS